MKKMKFFILAILLMLGLNMTTKAQFPPVGPSTNVIQLQTAPAIYNFVVQFEGAAPTHNPIRVTYDLKIKPVFGRFIIDDTPTKTLSYLMTDNIGNDWFFYNEQSPEEPFGALQSWSITSISY